MARPPALSIQLSPGHPSPTTPQSPLSASPVFPGHVSIVCRGLPPILAADLDSPSDNKPLSALRESACISPRSPHSRPPALGNLPLSQCDPFSLDSYGSLLLRSARLNKDLVLARVTTTSNGVLFHDFYDAYGINKVLFRTQPEEGLLHRMKCRNPLNNLEIVGDVWYYRVSAAEAIKAIEALGLRAERAAIPGGKRGQRLSVPGRLSISSAWNAAAELISPLRTSRHKRSVSAGPAYGTGVDESMPGAVRTLPSPVTVKQSERSSPIDLEEGRGRYGLKLDLPVRRDGAKGSAVDEKGLVIRADFLGTDDDFLMKASIRAYFKAHAPEPSAAALFPLSVPQPTDIPEAMPHPALPGYLYTLESPVEGSSSFLRTCHDLLFKVDESTMFRKVVTPGWRTLLVLYLIVGILVVKFVQGGVGNGLVYMGAFGIALVCIGSFVGVLGR